MTDFVHARISLSVTATVQTSQIEFTLCDESPQGSDLEGQQVIRLKCCEHVKYMPLNTQWTLLDQ